MSSVTRTIAVRAPVAAPAAERSRVAVLLETTKPGITRLVAFTSLTGFVVVAAAYGGISLALVAEALAVAAGTALAAAGANALNMWMESARDARMPRTASRPIPAGRLTPLAVLRWGVALVVAGVAVLFSASGPTPALLALASAVLYLFAYTPLKPRTPWCTLVGAVPGALPTVIGAAAASPAIGLAAAAEPAGLALFALLTVWQLPHFFALAWMYRRDYAAGGMRMLTVTDPSGRSMRVASLITALLLLPASLAPAAASPVLGWPYASIAASVSLAFVVIAGRLVHRPSDARARAVFFGSIVHLPLVLIAMLAEAAFAFFA